jgi:hypothetical protein
MSPRMVPQSERLAGIALMSVGAVICAFVWIGFSAGYFAWPIWALLLAGVFALWGGVMQVRG